MITIWGLLILIALFILITVEASCFVFFKKRERKEKNRMYKMAISILMDKRKAEVAALNVSWYWAFAAVRGEHLTVTLWDEYFQYLPPKNNSFLLLYARVHWGWACWSGRVCCSSFHSIYPYKKPRRAATPLNTLFTKGVTRPFFINLLFWSPI